MNILVVHPYLSVLGGGERVCLHVIKALVEDGHDVTLVSEPIKPGELDSFLGFNVLDDVAHVSYKKVEPKVRRFSVYQRMLHHNFLKPRLKGKIGAVDVELLTQDVAFTLGSGKKRIAYVHFPEFFAHLETAKPESKWFWKGYYAPFKRYMRHQIKNIDRFLCNSGFTKRKIKERWGKEAKTVYPPVDVERFKPAKKENLVATVGRFVPSKNYEMVLEVAKQLPDTDFEIIGIKQDPKYHDRINASKPKNVTLLTNLAQGEVASRLARAKVYLHTMINEHFGISIVESMASGCVPVVHDSGGAREAIGDLGYRYNTVKDCVNCIKKALQADADIGRLIERAKMFSSKRFREEIKKIVNCG